MSSTRVTTNFRDDYGTDLGDKLITKDYLMSVYPGIAEELGKTPELWVWGYNSLGELGTNDTINRLTPVTTFAGGANWKQVSCSGSNTAAIKTDGTLWVWGYNVNAQLGINNTIDRNTPVTTFAGGTNWKQVSGGSHTAAIKTDGTLWIWGWGSNGQIGNNNTTNRLTPVTTFAGGNDWKQVSRGSQHTAAIKTDGTLWTWGYNSSGQLGTADYTQRNTPVTTFAGGNDWKQVSAGAYHTAAIKTDGTLWIWGLNSQGKLGNGLITGYRNTPITTFAGGNDWKQVSAIERQTAAIKTDGTLWIWGYNVNGHLGINDTIDRSTPVTTFAGGTNWKQVSLGYYHTLAIKTDGTLWVWGAGSLGRLGTNDTTNRITPVTTFAGGTNWKQVSGGGFHSAAIQSSDFI